MKREKLEMADPLTARVSMRCLSGGTPRSSEEASVMEVERRGRRDEQHSTNNRKRDDSPSGAKSFAISKREVWEAWKQVKANKGSGGVDQESITTFEQKLGRNLYKLWNRMSSGSYKPLPVKEVSIPKSDGGKRPLGIPTVADRVAQTVVKNRLEPVLEKVFHKDSYGYRPGKSAHQALDVTRARCWKKPWVIDLDIEKFFDSIDHERMMRAVHHHSQERWVPLYIERWLKAPVEREDGKLEQRDRGTPQGGVISPLLANLYLHYTVDAWLERTQPDVEFVRYADDMVLHARDERQANKLLEELQKRFEQCGLRLHPTKTKIVYCPNSNKPLEGYEAQFTFLGYLFRQRSVRTKQGDLRLGFNPAISPKAKKAIGVTMRNWQLHRRSDLRLENLAAWVNPVVRGWIQYYTRYFKSEVDPLLFRLNATLIRWVSRKYKHLRRRRHRAYQWLQGVAQRQPNLFYHWTYGCRPATRS